MYGGLELSLRIYFNRDSDYQVGSGLVSGLGLGLGVRVRVRARIRGQGRAYG